MGPQFGETVYIFEVNGARKVKSNTEVDMNRNSADPMQKMFSSGWLGRKVPPIQNFPNF